MVELSRPRLRSKTTADQHGVHQLNYVPIDVVEKVGGGLVYLLAVGRNDISGDDWAEAFAKAIDGKHDNGSNGLVDVKKGPVCWSAKTIKVNQKPKIGDKIRLISGRNNVIYSCGIMHWNNDPQVTGDCVLRIWNERVTETHKNNEDTRLIVLLRSVDMTKFTIFESEVHRFDPNLYYWEVNSNNNMIGKDKFTNDHKFTWQPNGSQFTIIYTIPSGKVSFSVKRPDKLDPQAVLNMIKFDPSWVDFKSGEVSSL